MVNRLSLEMMMNREQLELQIKKEELKRDQCNINIDRWKKQLAEPKVLSAEEIYNDESFLDDGCINRSAVIRMLEAAIKNGRLDEWQRKEQVELRDAIKGVFDKLGESKICETIPRFKYLMDVINANPKAVDRLYDAVYGMKPPYENQD
jgi:hypothetical protein